MIQLRAYAKVNLGLRVGSRREDGYHPIHSIFQSIDWHDEVWLDTADEDELADADGGAVVDGWSNLAWQAATAVRGEANVETPLTVRLRKRIPIASGLGGGSADAAATLVAGARVLGVDEAELPRLAEGLGSDVPFCLVGGTARVSGRGEVVEPMDPIRGYALAIVVPPVELGAATVYDEWDRRDRPPARGVEGAALPPGLRSEAPLGNDLYAAAVSLNPQLDDWRHDLEESWGRPILMSGSGPSLFGFFADKDEADEALNTVPVGARATTGAEPVSAGWLVVEESDV